MLESSDEIKCIQKIKITIFKKQVLGIIFWVTKNVDCQPNKSYKQCILVLDQKNTHIRSFKKLDENVFDYVGQKTITALKTFAAALALNQMIRFGFWL